MASRAPQMRGAPQTRQAAAPPPRGPRPRQMTLRGATKTWGELAQATPHFARWRRHAQATEEPAAEAPVFMETYEGERDEVGRRRGTGRCVAPTHTYEGAWRDDAAHGEGVLTTS